LFIFEQVKRFIVIILALFYLLSATGVTAEHFYCCGKLAHTSFSIGDNGGNDKNQAKTDNCCKTTKQSFKVKDQHIVAKTFDLQAKVFAALQPGLIKFQPVAVYGRLIPVYQANAPPQPQLPSIYILNCTYRI